MQFERLTQQLIWQGIEPNAERGRWEVLSSVQVIISILHELDAGLYDGSGLQFDRDVMGHGVFP